MALLWMPAASPCTMLLPQMVVICRARGTTFNSQTIFRMCMASISINSTSRSKLEDCLQLWTHLWPSLSAFHWPPPSVFHWPSLSAFHWPSLSSTDHLSAFHWPSVFYWPSLLTERYMEWFKWMTLFLTFVWPMHKERWDSLSCTFVLPPLWHSDNTNIVITIK